MSMIEFKEKFIAYIDVLGFKNHVKAVEAKTGMTLTELLEMLKKFGSPEERDKFEKYGPIVCPQSTYIQRNLDFRLTQGSDCAVISSEVSPAGVINLVHHCWGIVIGLMQSGMMCRGSITRGPILHRETSPHFVGPGYQKALDNEKLVSAFKRDADEKGTPFVEIDRVVCDYVRECEDQCVKKMFSRCVKDDGEVVALFPFQRLEHSFVIGGFGQNFDPEQEKRSNQNVRLMVQNLKERVMAFVDMSNPSAVNKAEHYIQALNIQLTVCDRTDEIISSLNNDTVPK